jgi:hypothetical protein
MNTLKNLCRTAICLLILLSFHTQLRSQDDAEEVVVKPFITLKYYNIQNQSQYLILQCQLKTGKKLEPIKNLGANIFLDDETDPKNLIGKLVTDANGKAKTIIPASFRDQWKKSTQHKFIAVTDSIKGIGSKEAESEITIARLSLDTINEADTRTVKVKFEESKDGKWMPVKDVEIKLGVKRLGSILAVGEGETVTTDSSGTASAEFTRVGLPGDKNGLLTLVAKVEDNDAYGNLQTEKTVQWGQALKYENIFDKRSLWATGTKVPIWLLLVAGLIIFSVWGTLIYLIMRFIKTRKLGLTK